MRRQRNVRFAETIPWSAYLDEHPEILKRFREAKQKYEKVQDWCTDAYREIRPTLSKIIAVYKDSLDEVNRVANRIDSRDVSVIRKELTEDLRRLQDVMNIVKAAEDECLFRLS